MYLLSDLIAKQLLSFPICNLFYAQKLKYRPSVSKLVCTVNKNCDILNCMYTNSKPKPFGRNI